MISDLLFDAVDEIEDWEKRLPECYSGLTERLRRLKLEMLLIPLLLVPPRAPNQFTPAEYEWLEQECLKRANDKAPYEFGTVFRECATELRIKKFGR